jgi:myo-inositol 2-dehydrogenase / D-chiro-inositol 1-dehydrogenase
MYAAYKSAGSGAKVKLPFSAKVSKPIDLWLEAQTNPGPHSV